MDTSYLIIEPHGDDAFISCRELLKLLSKKDHCKVKLVTMSERSSIDFSKNLGIDYEYLDLPEINVYLKKKANTHEYHKAYLEGIDTYTKYYNEIYLDLKERINEVYDINLDTLTKVIKEFVETSENPVIISNLGLDHPYHIFVSTLIDEIVSSLNLSIPRLFYVDKPYFCKRYVKEIFEHHPIFRSSVDTMPLEVIDPETKEKEFTHYYPTERGLLRFTGESITQDDDIYVGESTLLKEVLCR